MKNLLLVAMIAVIGISCDKDEVEDFVYHPVVLDDLTLEALTGMIPLQLLSESTKAIFVSEYGDENELTVQYKKTLRDKTIEGFAYNSEEATIDYFDPDDQTFWISIHATHQYSSLTSDYIGINVFLSTSLNTSINQMPFSSFLLGIENLNCGYKHYDQYIIAGQEFHDVYTDIFTGGDEFASYTHAYYTPSQCIVGFQGKYGKMWALKELL